MKHMLNNSELSFFAGQLAMILHSGISVLEGVTIMTEDAEGTEGQDLLKTILEQLGQSGELAAALEKSGYFPSYFVKMTEIGEKSGTLEEIMQSLSGYYSRQHQLLRSIRDALTYPLILLIMLFAVLMVLISQVMPVFEEVFEQLGLEVTGVTAAVFRMGHLMQGGFAFLLILFVSLVAVVLLSLRHPKSRSRILSLAAWLPPVREIQLLLSCSRFSGALSLALHSGLDMGESFLLAGGLTELPEMKLRLEKAAAGMEEGLEFGEALRSAEVFSGLNARMVSIGFRTGAAETALGDISGRCQEEADEKIQAAVGAIEPAMTAVLSVLTGLILISVMLPLLSVMSNIG